MENFPLKSKDSLTQQCQLQVKVIIHSLTREKHLKSEIIDIVIERDITLVYITTYAYGLHASIRKKSRMM